MSLRDIAREKQVFSRLMEGREKLDTKDLIGEELHLSAVEVLTPYNKEPYMVCVVEEYPDNFFFAGSVLQDIIYALIGEVGSVADLNDELEAEPLGIKLESRQAKTANKTGRRCTYTAVIIL